MFVQQCAIPYATKLYLGSGVTYIKTTGYKVFSLDSFSVFKVEHLMSKYFKYSQMALLGLKTFQVYLKHLATFCFSVQTYIIMKSYSHSFSTIKYLVTLKKPSHLFHF